MTPNLNLAHLVVCGYARFSSEKQNASSTEDQLARIRRFVREHGGNLEPALEFRDDGISGQVADRPGLTRLLALVEARKVQVLVVEDASRLHRGEGRFFTLMEKLAYCDVRVIGIADGTDSFDPNASLAGGIRGLLSAQYIRDLSDKTLRGLRGRAERGLSTGGRALGYRSDPLPGGGYKLRIDPDEAETVRFIFVRYDEGWSLISIARELTRLGRPTARGGTNFTRQGWCQGSVRAILRNERYRGRIVFNRREWVRPPGEGRREPRPKDPHELIVFEDPSLAIVDETLWHRVQARMAAVRACYTRDADGATKGNQPGFRTNYPFSGLLACGKCGTSMVIQGGDVRRYKCGSAHKGRGCDNTRTVPEQVVREKVLAAMRDSLSGPALAYILKRARQRLDERRAEQPDEEAQARAHLEGLRKKAERLASFIAEGRLSPTVAAKLNETERAISDAEAKLAAAKSAASAEVALPTPEEVLIAATDLAASAKKDPVRTRESLRRVIVGGKVRMEPQADGRYVADFRMLPLAFLGNRNAAPDWLRGGVYGCGCGGRI